MSEKGSSKRTLDLDEEFGSLVYESCIVAMGLDTGLSRSILGGRMDALGMKEEDFTIEILGAMMGQIEEQLRKLLPSEQSSRVMSRLVAFIVNWEDPCERSGEIPIAIDTSETTHSTKIAWRSDTDVDEA